ncbi:MAG: type II toxin-antitoxin system RelE/ParE family toxin [Methanosarcinales archaeon]
MKNRVVINRIKKKINEILENPYDNSIRLKGPLGDKRKTKVGKR